MQIIGMATKTAAVAALLALASFLPANAQSPAPRDQMPILASAAGIQAPADEQVVDLADRSMRVFMTSVREKSMQAVWNHVSLQLRARPQVS